MMNPLAIAATATLGAMYLDAKHYISTDLGNLLKAKKGIEGMFADIAKMMAKDGYVSGYLGMERAIARYPNHVALISEDKSWTYAQVGQDIEKLAAWLLAQGCKKGDVVSVVMQNSAEIYITTFAMMKIGVVGALVNFNLAGAPLIHCLRTSGASITLCSSGCVDSLNALGQSVLKDELKTQCYVLDAFSNHPNPSIIEEKYQMPILELSKMPGMDRSWTKPKILHTDPAMLIYTSGTTGMPKAAVVPQMVYLTVMWTAEDRGALVQTDRMYCTMPLFHGSASIITMGNTVGIGATFMIAKGFKASTFISECARLNATAFVYVGEMIRYLMSTPEGPKDKQHKVRLALGNGLRPDIWEKFRTRFGVTNIWEFYAATEGQYASFNHNYTSNGAGKVGRFGLVNRLLDPSMAIIKHDDVTEELVRDPKTGFCIKCQPGQPGELIGQIFPISVQRPYYKNKEATNKKILKDVFVKGDTWFRMGDIMMVDHDGWLNFCDRLGDTFRWKGENVATDEVTLHMGVHQDIADVAVYGLPLKSYEGQAGMAAITLKESAKIESFMSSIYPFMIKRGVPEYACPRFIRLMDVITQTHTHKHQKAKLRADGIAEESTNGDRLFMLDASTKVYVPLEQVHRKLLTEGKARL